MQALSFKNANDGFSLTSVIVAMGIAGIFAMGIVNLSSAGQKAQSHLTRSVGLQLLRKNLDILVSLPSACSASLTGLPADGAPHAVQIFRSPGNRFLPTTSGKIDGWTIESVEAEIEVPVPGNNVALVTVRLSRNEPEKDPPITLRKVEAFTRVTVVGGVVTGCPPAPKQVIGGCEIYVNQGTATFVATRNCWGLATPAGQGTCPVGSTRQVTSQGLDSVSLGEIGSLGEDLRAGCANGGGFDCHTDTFVCVQ